MTRALANRVLILDDEPDICDLLKDAAISVGFEAVTTRSSSEFFLALDTFFPRIVLLDLMMPEVDGISVLRRLADRHSNLKIFLMSGTDTKVLTTARKLGEKLGLDIVDAYRKPFDLKGVQRQLAELREKFPGITREEIESGLAENQFEIFLQPKVTVSAHLHYPIESAEALLRWNHPTRGLLTPDMFLDSMVEFRLMRPCTEKVLDEAIRYRKGFEDQDLDISIAINVPAQLFEDPQFLNHLEDQLDQFAILPGNLILEITEHDRVVESLTAIENLTRLRLKGFSLSMDDFGTGYSSLADFWRLPFSELKIDRQFVSHLDEDEDSRVIVRAILGLARNFEMAVCAEGVETESTLKFLEAEGCDVAQGFFISRPLPFDEFVSFCHAWRGAHPDLGHRQQTGTVQ